ncbi:MAG: type 1 glutamine amidotransferase domain-containing protein [bacterium]
MAKLTGKKVAFLVSDEFEDIEFLFPLLRLSEEGAKAVVATLPALATRPAIPGRIVTGRFGTTIPPLVMREGRRFTHTTVDKLDISDVDCIIIPGGFSPDALRINETVLNLVRKANEDGKIIAAICHGPQVLISAGIIKGKMATCYAAVRDDIINAGAKFSDVPAIRDGNIITGRVPDDLPEFCQEIIKALSES